MIRTIQDIEELEKTPLSERKLPPNTYAMLAKGAARNPQALALRFFLQGTEFQRSTDFTFTQLLGHFHQAANMFRDLGITENEVVSFILPNLPETWFTLWGGEIAGIVNPINPLLEAEQMADIMNAAQSKVLVTLAPFPKTDLWDKVALILDKVPTLEVVLTVDLSVYLSGFKKLMVNLIKKKAHSKAVKVLDFNKTLKSYPSDRLSFERDIQPNDIASYFHTGGTTGTPKLAAHTHFNEVADAWSGVQILGGDREEQQVFYCGLPLFHVNGVIVTGLIPWSVGATVVLGTPQGYRGAGVFDNFWKIVEHYKVNFFSGVPTVYQMLLDVPVGNHDISSLDFALCGAAPMPVELFKNFQEKTKVKILEGYGLTEGTCASSVNPLAGEKKIGSVGLRFPYQLMKTIILDEDGKFVRNCAVNEIGIVVVNGPNVFPGYKQKLANEKAFIDCEDGLGKWLNTGDLGRQDEDGYFWLTGRKKEIIIRGGHNIDPRIIEEPLHEHPAVALAAAIGRPDARVGEVPVVYVQAQLGSQVDENELLEFVKNKIKERAALPKAIRIIETMPLTSVGKIFKPQLIWKEVSEVYTTEIQNLEGIEQVQVEVKPDKVSGMLAHIQVKAQDAHKARELEKLVQDKLGAYAIQYNLTIQ